MAAVLSGRVMHVTADSKPREGRRRVVIEGVSPEIDAGRFPIKRTVGEQVVVEADVFADGHDEVACALRYRPEGRDWREAEMAALGNDRWRGSFTVTGLGRWRYGVIAWIDRFGTWWHDLLKRIAAGQDVSTDLEIGALLVEAALRRARGDDRKVLRGWTRRLRAGWEPILEEAIEADLLPCMARHPDRRLPTRYARELEVVVDRERARFGAWYELFPRSPTTEAVSHGTLADVEKRLPYVAELGFDVLYLPPIHPIGSTHRKGPNNLPEGGPDDPGVPWAIGTEEGGHTAVHPDLGTLDDFDRLLEVAAEHGVEIAMDLAYQCSPDHPWVREHPEWFRRRPDGTIQYAENPPKKYQDIYPIDFETEDWAALWDALKMVVDFWIARGVRIFRVDNPHTKPYAFWEWMIPLIREAHPDVIFLSEAFTRPKVMHRLAKLGFTQSYTYFAWRNSKWELEQYFGVDLPQVREFFRPNLWPNTPDILTGYLQTGGRAAFAARLVLAATLGASYGIYGPAFELLERTPREAGSEEYLGSEKYQVRHWDLDRPDSLAPLIARVNRIRREHPALQHDRTLRFHPVDNERLLAYSKVAGDDTVLVVVNLDPQWKQSGWVDLPLDDLGIDPAHPFGVHDLLSGERFVWDGGHNYVELDPETASAHVFGVEREAGAERDR
jgi:starch synthase (maltosyl-transferring)